ncbi:MAG: glycosyltransferase [Bryobacteraceae bacterium]|nr:glycosyltransferase [Bryobacteraceae bacterium]
MKIKTLHITNAWHGSSGGISTFYKELLKAANRHAHPLRLVVPAEKSWVEEVGEYGRIYHVAARRAPLNSSYRMIFPNRFLLPGRNTLGRIIEEERPDLIEISDKYSLLYLAGLLRQNWAPGVSYRPTVIGLTCERMDENMAAYVASGRLAMRFCRFYMKNIYFPMFDHHIAISDHTAEELVPASHGHRVQRGVWISPMGADCEGFNPARRSSPIRTRLLEQAGGGEETVLLLYAGRLVPEKNLGLLLETMVHLTAASRRDYRLLIAGDGILREQLREEAERRVPGKVRMLGHVGDREALANLYANSDIFVHPNPKEPFGIAPLEAMASGLPLVAPASGGVTVYANETNAWLAAPDAVSFAGAIERALSDPTRQQRILNARRTAERYRWENVTAQFLQLYRDLHAFRIGMPRPEATPPSFVSTGGGFLGFDVASRESAHPKPL